jgi:hypothetical protein
VRACTDRRVRAVSGSGVRAGWPVRPSARGASDRRVGPKGRGTRESVPNDLGRWIRDGRLRSNARGFNGMVADAASVHGSAVAGDEAGTSSRGFEVAGADQHR